MRNPLSMLTSSPCLCSTTKADRCSAIQAVLVLILVAFIIRVPGIPWGIVHGDFYEPDEFQHTNIANFQLRKLGISVGDGEDSFPFGPRAFGTQIAVLALAGHQFGVHLSNGVLVLIGRLLSLAYGVFLPALLYLFARYIFQSHLAGMIAGLILAVSDLHVTYSHYGVPEASHAFWFLFSVFLLVVYSRNGTAFIRGILGVGLGMCLATKFDPTPLLAFILILIFKRSRPISRRIADLILVCTLLILTLLFSWLTVDIETFVVSAKQMASANFDLVKDNSPLLYNPLLYVAAIVAGMSVPIVLTAFLALVVAVRDRRLRKQLVVLLIAPAFLFVNYWVGDSTFVRRAIAFVPFVALLSGVYVAKLSSHRSRVFLATLMIGYTFVLTAISQFDFIKDPRYKARKYLLEECKVTPTVEAIYSPYSSAVTRDLPNRKSMASEWYPEAALVILHETYYGRYSKSFTTPFRIPKDCNEVYNCNPMLFRIIQDMLFGRSSYKIIKKFEIWHPFPERIAFKALFGTYDTFLGDVLIFANPHSFPCR